MATLRRIPIKLAPKASRITSILRDLSEGGRVFSRLKLSGVIRHNEHFAFIKGRSIGIVDALAAGQRSISRSLAACERIGLTMHELMDMEDGWNGMASSAPWATVGRVLAAKFVDGAL